jgi:hypothetical protein
MHTTSTRRLVFETVTSAVTKTIVTGMILFCGLQFAARADVTYTYTGSEFGVDADCCGFATSPYSLTDNVSGSFTVAAALGDSMSFTDITSNVTSFSFSDGVQTLTNLSALPDVTFEVGTDASGNIDAWFINLENPSPYVQIATNSGGLEDLGSSSGGEGYIRYDASQDAPQPGWVGSSSTSPVPEPNMSWILFGLLTGGAAMMRLRRSKRQPE